MRFLNRALLLGLFLLVGCGGGSMAAGGGALVPVPAPAVPVLPALPGSPVLGKGFKPAPVQAAIATATPSAQPTALPGEVPRQSDAFVDSIGINTHMHYDGNSPYNARFTTFAPLLVATGIRHLRDGLTDTTWQGYYDHINQLGRAGIHATLITSVGQTAALLQAYPARVASAFEAYEAPNEYDASGDPNWRNDLAAFQRTLYTAVKSYPPTAAFPVLGPALIASASDTALGNQSASLDYGNMHDYFAGYNPGTPGWGGWYFGGQYGGLTYNLGAEAQVSGSKPIIATETGYSTLAGTAIGLPLSVQAKYMARLFFEQFNGGVVRTFGYEFADEGGGAFGWYGLTDFNLNRKPSYYALTNVIHLLSDAGSTFTTTPLAFGISGSTAAVHHTLLQKRDGTYELAMWIERPGWDVNTMTTITVAPQVVTVTMPSLPLASTISTLDDAGTMSTAPLAFTGNAASVTVTDRVSILSVKLF